MKNTRTLRILTDKSFMLLITNSQNVLHCKAYRDTRIKLNMFQAEKLKTRDY